jgi:hypothetical protein
MIGQNPKKPNAKKLNLFISYVVILDNICAKNIYITTMYKKIPKYSKKD